MSTTAINNPTQTSMLPAGSWRVDPAASRLTFVARAMWGLVAVKGAFHDYEGELEVDDAGARGELRIKAASLDTHNAKRDTHLRSADFFDAANSETLTFALSGVAAASDGTLTGTGELRIRSNALKLTAPLELSEAGPNHILVRTSVPVDRVAAGVGWNKLGMIQGPAKLAAELTLVRAD